VYARGFEKRSGVSVQVEVSQEVGRLEENREIALFRIIQESFGNIHRHSGSYTASVKIFCLEGDMRSKDGHIEFSARNRTAVLRRLTLKHLLSGISAT
jgi:signal transduction histidine kinase